MYGRNNCCVEGSRTVLNWAWKPQGNGNSDLQDLRFLVSAETRPPGSPVILATPSKSTLEVHTDPAFYMPSPVLKLRAFGLDTISGLRGISS